MKKSLFLLPFLVLPALGAIVLPGSDIYLAYTFESGADGTYAKNTPEINNTKKPGGGAAGWTAYVSGETIEKPLWAATGGVGNSAYGDFRKGDGSGSGSGGGYTNNTMVAFDTTLFSMSFDIRNVGSALGCIFSMGQNNQARPFEIYVSNAKVQVRYDNAASTFDFLIPNGTNLTEWTNISLIHVSDEGLAAAMALNGDITAAGTYLYLNDTLVGHNAAQITTFAGETTQYMNLGGRYHGGTTRYNGEADNVYLYTHPYALIPEPVTGTLSLLGLAGLALFRRRI